jgi:hypothetical protein
LIQLEGLVVNFMEFISQATVQDRQDWFYFPIQVSHCSGTSTHNFLQGHHNKIHWTADASGGLNPPKKICTGTLYLYDFPL